MFLKHARILDYFWGFVFFGVGSQNVYSIVERGYRATDPHSRPTISPNTSNQNFEIAILLSTVKRSKNHVFEDEDPRPPWCKGFKLYTGGTQSFIERVVT